MIKGSIILPVWNSRRIAWIAMESFCRMLRPKEGWELIIFEERHDQGLGRNFYMSYEPRLLAMGCERIHFMTSMDKVPLPQKWVRMAHETSPTSKYYIMCAADNFYHQWTLQDAEKNIPLYDWCCTTQGYFYDIKLNKLIKYGYNGNIGLQMYANTELVRKLPLSNLKRGIDGWFYKNLHAKKILRDPSDHWKGTLCTNGLNNISTSRHIFFTRPHRCFQATNTQLQDIIPVDIYDRLIQLHNEIKR